MLIANLTSAKADFRFVISTPNYLLWAKLERNFLFDLWSCERTIKSILDFGSELKVWFQHVTILSTFSPYKRAATTN